MQRDNLDFLEQLLTSQFTISHLPITKEWTIIYYETADFCAFTCAFISTRISNMLNIQCKIFTLISSRDEAKVHSFSSILMNVKYKDVKMHESSQSIYYINTSYETSLGNERVDYFSRQEDQASSSALFFLESHETAEGRLYPTLSQVQREKSAARFMKCSKHVTERRSWQSAYSFIPLIILIVAALITLELVQLDNALAIKKKKKNIRSSATVKRVVLNAFIWKNHFLAVLSFFQRASPTFINDASQKLLNCLRRCCFNNIKLAN